MNMPKLNAEAMPGSQLDPQQIAMLRTLRNGALLPQLLRTYRDQVTKQVAELRAAVDRLDHATLRIVAHTLKSASFSVGANRVGELCTDLEAHAIKQTLAHCAGQITALEVGLVDLLTEIDGYLTP
jgi:HPt (histidine-containing phosphotransfer) domain-containing protein